MRSQHRRHCVDLCWIASVAIGAPAVRNAHILIGRYSRDQLNVVSDVLQRPTPNTVDVANSHYADLYCGGFRCSV
jgi:hypothetical protein